MADNITFSHVPVLLGQCLEGLLTDPEGIYVDCTLGGGGHSERIVQALRGNGRLICIDRDEDAIRAASARLAPYRDRITFVHRNFSEVGEILAELGIEKITGALADLGVSSYQLDTPQRGFSYLHDAPLDMRMDTSASLSAYRVVNEYPEEELYRILRDYGEERFAKRIAGLIVQRRAEKPIERTRELCEIASEAIPAKFKNDGHPARRTFQAIRIEVNGELEIIPSTVHRLTNLLAPGGRLCIITFHSLEDRLVKEAFAEEAKGCTCPKDFPVCVCGKVPKVKILTKKPITADEEELIQNSRSHSAKLRIAEKL